MIRLIYELVILPIKALHSGGFLGRKGRFFKDVKQCSGAIDRKLIGGGVYG
jgi:hypothetical protein